MIITATRVIIRVIQDTQLPLIPTRIHNITMGIMAAITVPLITVDITGNPYRLSQHGSGEVSGAVS